MFYFEKYRDISSQWRWTYYASNGEPLSISSEAYVREADCDHAIDLMKRTVPGAVIRRRAA